MSVVVFLSNTNIQIAVGSSTPGGVRVSKLFSAPLPEGAILNGVVMDQDLVTNTIKSVWQQNKLSKADVTLIVNSPQLRANRIDAPIQPDKKTTAFIKRETADSEYGRFQKPVTAWYSVSKDNKAKTQKVIYETAESEFVNKYVDIFDKAGLKLKSIHNGVQIATEFLTKQTAGKTVIYMILDGNSLVTIFFAEGKYYYDSTSRVFSQPGTSEFAREIYSSISSIRQFMSAQHIEATVKDVLFAGLTQPQVTTLSNDILNLDSQIDVSVINTPSGTSISDGQAAFPFYVYPIAGLRKIDEKLPILKAIKQNSEKSAERGSWIKLAIPFVCIAVVAAIAYVGVLFYKSLKEKELKELQDYIYDSEVIVQAAEFDAMYNNMEEMGTIQGGADLLQEDLDSYPIPDSRINRKILAAAAPYGVDVSFNTYDSLTGVFSITAQAQDVDDINLFIADLLAMDDIFENVDYTGYTLNSEGTSWQINVVCSLAANEPAPSEISEEVN